MKFFAAALFSLLSILGSIRANEAELLAFLEQHLPEVHEVVIELRETDPYDFKEALREAEDAKASFERVRKYSAVGAAAFLEMFRIDFFAVGIADEIVLSDDPDEKARLKTQLTKMIDDSFDHWVVYERARIEQLERVLKQTRERFEEEAGSKAEIIEQDVEQLLRESRQYQRDKRLRN